MYGLIWGHPKKGGILGTSGLGLVSQCVISLIGWVNPFLSRELFVSLWYDDTLVGRVGFFENYKGVTHFLPLKLGVSIRI